ncbi:hypothetical protein IIB79_02720 [candidate division KSB1 bacterium]|nr:hypothetical protein [candidate division KSB1 bacterium]
MKVFFRFCVTLVSVLGLLFACSQSEVGNVSPGSIPTPESVIGFVPGTDYKMANWDQIYSYFKALGDASDRVLVVEHGETEQGRPMITAVISSPANLANIENLKSIRQKLADPRLTSDSELPGLIADGKAVVLVSSSLHATELGATQASPVIAYQLATDNSDVVKQILENVVFVYFPAANPDGVQMTADHYMSQNPGPGVNVTSLPRIYSEYTGHDNNRDWYMLTQKESMIIGKQMYEEWHPEIVFDMHQKGQGARIFVPPFAEPLNPLINPLIVRQLEMLGGYMTTDLIAGGYPWVEDHVTFSMWWHGGMRTAPYFHNMVGILSEVASANLASPREPEGRSAPTPTINYPVPWQDDRVWRLSDIIEQDRIVVMSVLKAAARNKDMYMRNYYTMNKEAVEKGESEKPFAFVMPADQHDKGALVYFLETMLKQDTDFEIATEEFTAGGTSYPEGSIIAFLAQPARAHLLGMMDNQIYPAERRPYDITGWNLPLQMGVEYDKIDETFEVNTQPYTVAVPVAVNVRQDNAQTFYIGGNSIDHFKAVNKLFAKGYSLSMITEPHTVNGIDLPPGSIVVDGQGTVAQDLADMSNDLSITIVESGSADNSTNVPLSKPRIGLINNPNSMPVGWMRWTLEKYEFDFDLVDYDDFETGNLNERFDVLLYTTSPQVPGGGGRGGRGGGRGGRGGRGGQQLTPEQIQDQQEAATRRQEAQRIIRTETSDFVSGGGTVVAWSGAVTNVAQTLGLRISPAQFDRQEFSIPGSVLKINVDTSHPVTFGMQEETYIFFRNNSLLRVDQGRILGRYPNANPLVSGYVLGPERIQNTPGIIHETLGSGKVVLISFEPMFRAQPVGTFKLIFNSILYSGMPAVR